MSKILVIAEKPSMGRDIAQAIGAMTRSAVSNDRLFQVIGNYTVVGAQGHLFSLVNAEEYGSEFAFPWRVEPLPVLPEQFLLEPNFQRKNGKVVESDLTKAIRARIAKIKELVADADEIIHAGDPDREGQLIIDDIIRRFKFTGQVSRLWLHAQTKDGIIDALKKMRNNTYYANLGIAALARRESDWAIGINGTRAYSALWWKKGHKGVLNIGRVVTPVVGMLVQREKDIRNFCSIAHFNLRAQINIKAHAPFWAKWVRPEGENNPHFDPSGKYMIDQPFIESIRAKCQNKPAEITKATKLKKTENPPLLFSLTELQKLAARMGYSPDQVLAAAQALYEKHKLTSYPRTECQFAPESEHSKAPAVIKSIEQNFNGSWSIPSGWETLLKSPAWNDAKLEEHYAILPLPTSCPVSGLSKCEHDVYRLICRQYIAQFFPKYEYMATTLEVDVAGEVFRATGRTPMVEGWRVLFGGMAAAKKLDPDSDEQDTLPDVAVHDRGIANPVETVAKQTEPPSRFTAITLLDAMEKAYLFVTDPKVKAKLKQVEGIGTAATRASIIAKVVASDFAVEGRAGKVISYVPTAKAFGYIECVPEMLTRPDLTAWFEGKLEDLATGNLEYLRYRGMLAKLVSHSLASAKNGEALKRMPSPGQIPETVVAKPRTRAKKAVAKSRKKSRSSVRGP
jgi:DNA topoisomerase-3